jgi:Flp pilus assembly protein TadD
MADAQEPEGSAEGEAAFDTGAAGIAIALDEARGHPSLRGEVAAFLSAQRKLTQDQRRRLKAQEGDLRLKTASDWVKLALQGLTLAALLAVAAALAMMVRDAVNARGLVVEGFSTPPAFAARGLNGEALAADLASRIAAVERFANANSLTRSDDVRAGGSEAVKLQIPETGVSLGEVSRFLRSQLGHETPLSGQLIDEGAGRVAINMQLPGSDPVVVHGSASDMDGLLQLAAEKAFAAFDPGNFVLYLNGKGREDEALAAAQDAVLHNASAAAVYTIWAGFDGDRRRALERAKLSTELEPKSMVAWMEAAGASQHLGHDEAMLAYARRSLKSRIEDQIPSQRGGFGLVMSIGRTRIDGATGDFSHLESDSLGMGSSIPLRLVAGAQAAAGLHDAAGVERNLARALLSSAPPGQDMLLATRWQAAAANGDWPAALAAADALVRLREQARAAAPAGGVTANRLGFELETRDRPWLAYAEAMNGRAAEAQALIAGTPLDCYLCIRTRGLVAAAAGDGTGADRWFAEAVRQGPSLPLAHLEWGRVKLARGDVGGAAAEFQKAQALGPHFADPLEASGEALAARKDFAGAAAKYALAAGIAPRWGHLHLKWAEALASAGRADDARMHLRTAAGLGLSAPDRAELAAQRL